MKLPVFWPSDKIIIAYSIPMCAIELIWFHQIADAGWLLALHAIAIVALILAARWVEQRPSITSGPVWVFRHWYPLLYVACCYREMAMIIAGIRHNHADMALAAIDHAFWGVYPTVWLERLYSPAFTEFLQVVYTLFLPVALIVPLTIWLKGRFTEFRYMAFLLSLGFLVSYLGYIAVPAHGPRFALLGFQHLPLKGLWLFNWMQATLNRLETDHYDCFPSGHTELTILACWLSRSLSKRIFWAYFLYTLCIIFATVYLRYHYTVDLLAGVVVAVVLILAAPRLYRVLSAKGESIGD